MIEKAQTKREKTVKTVGYEMTLWDRLYLPAIFQGLGLTIRQFFSKKWTMEYPEQTWEVKPGYRGLHRLNKDDQGRVKCVACYMCSTVCPAHCIHITAEEAPWPDREKVPQTFDIDELRCIFCGLCEEACPEDAIELTRINDMHSLTREELYFTKEDLLDIFEKTKDEQPMKSWSMPPGSILMGK